MLCDSLVEVFLRDAGGPRMDVCHATRSQSLLHTTRVSYQQTLHLTSKSAKPGTVEPRQHFLYNSPITPKAHKDR